METPMGIWTPAVFKRYVESQYYPIYSGIYIYSVKLQVNTGNNSDLQSSVGLITRSKKVMTPKNNMRREEINSQKLKFR